MCFQAGTQSRQVQKSVRSLLSCFWSLNKTTSILISLTNTFKKEINPGYSLEGLILKLKLQYFGHLMQNADLLENTLILGKMEGRRRMEQQRMWWLDGIIDSWTWVWADLGDCEGQGSLAVHGVAVNLTRLSDWATIAITNTYHVVSLKSRKKNSAMWNAKSNGTFWFANNQ